VIKNEIYKDSNGEWRFPYWMKEDDVLKSLKVITFWEKHPVLAQVVAVLFSFVVRRTA